MSNKINNIFLITVLVPLFAIYIYTLSSLVSGWGPSSIYSNVSVKTTVNITQSYPEIINVSCNSGAVITLNAGTTKNIICFVQIMDYNGGNTINSTNVTFYYYLNSSSDPNDNNDHYTNASCTASTTDGFYTNWTCGLDIWYYANNGSWKANVTVKDSYNLTDNDYRNATISTLYALNVTQLIDFGNLPSGDTSLTPVQANITNFGNMNINVTIYGFGGEDEVLYAGLAMVCDQRNLTLPNERYSLTSTDYDSMTSLTGSATTISGLTVYKQEDDAQQQINSTYWRLHVNVTTNPFGVCNGTVIFAAEAS